MNTTHPEHPVSGNRQRTVVAMHLMTPSEPSIYRREGARVKDAAAHEAAAVYIRRMAQDHDPEDFNWVAAQSKCTPAAVFETLRSRIREDVQRRNGLLGRHDGWTFEFTEEGDEFEVARAEAGRRDGRVLAVVSFTRSGRRILVHSEDLDVDLTAIVTLDHTGACRLVIGEAMYSDWEFRRMALEQLFFEEVEEED